MTSTAPPEKQAMGKADLDLLQEYKAGRADALADVVERYRKPLFGFILNMSVTYDEADDIFQEAWLRAIRNLHRFDNRNFMAWIFQIARNLVIDRNRRSKSVASLDAENDEGETLKNLLPDTRKNPAQEADCRDQAARAAQALNALAPEQKEVFLLRVEADMSFREIAEIQGVSINTALGRMHYAILRLRQTLQEAL